MDGGKEVGEGVEMRRRVGKIRERTTNNKSFGTHRIVRNLNRRVPRRMLVTNAGQQELQREAGNADTGQVELRREDETAVIDFLLMSQQQIQNRTSPLLKMETPAFMRPSTSATCKKYQSQ